MPDENQSFVLFNANGANRKIIISTPPKSSARIDATKIHMQNVEEKSTGGKISHNAERELIQIGGNQTARGEGKITNRVGDGKLYQENLGQLAEDKGEIINEVINDGIDDQVRKILENINASNEPEKEKIEQLCKNILSTKNKEDKFSWLKQLVSVGSGIASISNFVLQLSTLIGINLK
jgi:hypothetical protein